MASTETRDTQLLGIAHGRLDAVALATKRLGEQVDGLDQPALHDPSLLPGWSRGHVLTHLARNADSLVNLLTWARTGVEHPAYASRADRDADIAEGSGRSLQVIREDLTAACQRFATAGATLPHAAWHATVATSNGKPVPATMIPLIRLREVWIHLIDLDVGITFTDIPTVHLPDLLTDAVTQYTNHPGTPTFHLTAHYPNGPTASWSVGTPASGVPASGVPASGVPANGAPASGASAEGAPADRAPAGDASASGAPASGGPAISGPAAAALGWLTGRSDGADLTGELPDLPPWA